jgi:hypothetical protein
MHLGCREQVYEENIYGQEEEVTRGPRKSQNQNYHVLCS